MSRYVSVLPLVQLRAAVVVGTVPHPKAGPFPLVLSSIDAQLHPGSNARICWPDVSGELVQILADLADRGCVDMRVFYPALS